MRVLTYGKEHEKTLLFLPCTAEPAWAFTDAVTLLAQDFRVMQIVYDGHGETDEDFVSVEKTVDDVTAYLTAHGICRLDAAYGCSLGRLGFRLVTKNRKLLEAAYPPQRWTLPGRDPAEKYDALAAYLKTYSARTVRNIFWSANNYALPPAPAKTGCRLAYWYGEEEKKARRHNIRFITGYFPHAGLCGIPQMDHAELVMIHPQEFYRYAKRFLDPEG